MPTESYAQYHNNEVTRVSREAFRLMMEDARAGISSELYLWFTPRLKQLHVATEKPHEDSQLGNAERIPTHLTQQQLDAWFAARTGRLPYLGGA